MWHRLSPSKITVTFLYRHDQVALVRRPEDESANLDALARGRARRAGWILKRRVSGEARPSVLFRVIALQQDDFATLELFAGLPPRSLPGATKPQLTIPQTPPYARVSTTERSLARDAFQPIRRNADEPRF